MQGDKKNTSSAKSLRSGGFFTVGFLLALRGNFEQQGPVVAIMNEAAKTSITDISIRGNRRVL